MGQKRTLHNCNPSPRIVEELEGRKLLDPFAGFGSIPLEGMRFGSNATAVELLPTAYVFLKGDGGISGSEAKQLEIEDIVRSFNDSREMNNSIEYKLPRQIYDMVKWGNHVTQQLKDDQDIEELYDMDIAVCIGSWEVKRPFCGRYTPLIGN